MPAIGRSKNVIYWKYEQELKVSLDQNRASAREGFWGIEARKDEVQNKRYPVPNTRTKRRRRQATGNYVKSELPYVGSLVSNEMCVRYVRWPHNAVAAPTDRHTTTDSKKLMKS